MKKSQYERRKNSSDPWGILLVALPFLVGGLMLVSGAYHKVSVTKTQPRNGSLRALVITVEEARAIGAFSLIAAAAIGVTYFRVRWQIRRAATLAEDDEKQDED